MTEDVVEKRGSDGEIWAEEFFSRYASELIQFIRNGQSWIYKQDETHVSNVGENIENCNAAHGGRQSDAKGSIRVFDFWENLITKSIS